MAVLDVSRDFLKKRDGGSHVAKRNHELLAEVFGVVDNLFIPVPSIRTRIVNYLFSQSYGQTRNIYKKFRKLLEDKKYDFVFFDGSTYGGFVKAAKNRGIKVITFYHNVEKRYYEEKARITNSILDRMIVPYIVHNERLSTLNSDYIITLNQRDSDGLFEAYGRRADLVWPSSFSEAVPDGESAGEDPYLLFVGTNFFANIEGVRFIIDELAGHTKYPIKIVGNVCDSFINEEIPSSVEFVGEVDDLAPWYRGAVAVLAPIFSGSGLKTKTVEALSYGKYVIGSREAFEGIDISSYPDAGAVCADVSDYIAAMESENAVPRNKVSLDLFNNRFSHRVAFQTLKNFIDSIK